MSDAEADALLAFLDAAGSKVEHVAYCVWDQKPIPPGTDLTSLYPEDWDTWFTVMWDVLPDSDPRAARVNDAMARFFAEPAFAKALEEAHNREWAAWAAAQAEREELWEVA